MIQSPFKRGTALGSVGFSWTGFTVANLNSSNDGRASSSPIATEGQLKNFGFSIPSGATILGVQILIEGRTNSSIGTAGYSIRLSYNNGTNWTSAKTGSFTGDVDTIQEVGGAFDAWGRTWDNNDFDDGNLLLGIQYNGGSGHNLEVDEIKIRVFYTLDITAAPIIMAVGDQRATATSNLNTSTAAALEWRGVTKHATFFDFSTGNKTRLVVKKAGDYLLSFNSPLSSDLAAANRNGVQFEVRVNGTKKDVGVGRATYISNQPDQYHSSGHLTTFLADLAVDDYIEIFVIRTTTDSTNQILVGEWVDDLTVFQSRFFTCYIEALGDNRTVFAATGTRTIGSTNLNTSADSMQWSAQLRKDTGFTHSTSSNSHQITLDASGNYLVSVVIPLGSAVVRANVLAKVLLDSAQIDGGQFKQGYIRNTTGHSKSSLHFVGIVEAGSASQVLSITVEQEAAAGTVDIDGEKAVIFIEKLPSTKNYLGEATQTDGGGNNFAPSSGLDIDWATNEVQDTGVYSKPDVHQVQVLEAGNYLLALNGAFTATAARINAKMRVYVNNEERLGSFVASHYIRNTDGHNDSSGAMTILLTDLQVNDIITVQTVRENYAVTGTLNDSTPLLLSLIKKDSALFVTKQIKTKSLQYIVTRPTSVTKSLKYCVKIVPAAKTKSLQYSILQPYSRQAGAALPSNDNQLSTIYSASEVADVATDNGVRVSQQGINAQYVIHQYKSQNAGGGTSDHIHLAWNGQTNIAPSTATVYLQIYNRQSGTWETKDSNNSAAADTDFNLSADITTINSTPSDYYDANMKIAVRVYQKEPTV